MARYIELDALLAEIEKRIKETESMQPKFDQFWAGQISAFKGVLKMLDTLEVKEVDLEKEIDRYYNIEAPKEFEDVLYEDIEKFAKHFFELGMQVSNNAQKEPVSEDLEEAAVEAFKQIVDADKNNFLEIFKAGAKWKEQQMMKEAIDGEVGYWNQRALSILMKPPRELDDEDKCKVIIIKSE